jgi:predicted DCC family thiol-disulfide oxidoreductase YuxK
VPDSQSNHVEKMSPSASGSSILLYDGDCGFCQRAVRWMLRHDAQSRLLFASLQSPLATELFARHALDPQQVDSAVLVTNFNEPAERVSRRSDAILGCLTILGGAWAFFAAVTRPIPRPLRDSGYDWFARHRHRIFASGESCAPLTATERTRLLGD